MELSHKLFPWYVSLFENSVNDTMTSTLIMTSTVTLISMLCSATRSPDSFVCTVDETVMEAQWCVAVTFEGVL